MSDKKVFLGREVVLNVNISSVCISGTICRDELEEN
jgi:hypothetical protein